MPIPNPTSTHLSNPYARSQSLSDYDAAPPGGRPPFGPSSDPGLMPLPGGMHQGSAQAPAPAQASVGPLGVLAMAGLLIGVGVLAARHFTANGEDDDDEDEDDDDDTDAYYARNASVAFVEPDDEDEDEDEDDEDDEPEERAPAVATMAANGFVPVRPVRGVDKAAALCAWYEQNGYGGK